MKYQQPYGISDSDASYINSDRTVGRQGSIPPAAAMEQPQREIVNLIRNSQQVPTDNDLEQLTRGVRDGKLNYCRDTGGVNSIQVTLSPPITSYDAGMLIRVIVAHTVTGPTTISCDGLNPVFIRRRDGSNLQNRDILQGQIATLVCDGTVFQLQNMGVAEPVEAEQVFYRVDIPYVRDTSVPTDGNSLIGAYSPPLPDIAEGRTVEIKLNRAVTGPTVFTPNSFPTKPVARPDGSPVQAGDGVTNQIWLLAFDSEQWQIIGSRFDWAPAVVTPAYVGRSLQFTYGGYLGPSFQRAKGFNTYLTRRVAMNTNRSVWTMSQWLRYPQIEAMADWGPSTAGGWGYGAESWWNQGYAGMGGDFTGFARVGNTQGPSSNLAWANSMYMIAGMAYMNPARGYFTIPWLVDTKWHHLLLVADGANMSLYTDGILTARGPTSGPGAINGASEHVIGTICPTDIYGPGSIGYGCSGRLAEIYFIDGQAISDYLQFCDNLTRPGILLPKPWTGTFGPNGYYLNWQNATAATAATLGKDFSGNNNDFTPVNFQITDVVPDFPGIVN
jgi:hypothetical protein